MDNKERYRQLFSNETYSSLIPVFSWPFWLDAVAQHWDVCLLEEKGKVIAALPYCLKGKLITRRIYLPDLSFYQSVIFFSSFNKIQEQKVIASLFQQLPLTAKSYFKFLPQYSGIDLSSLGYMKEEYSSYMLFDEIELNISSNHARNVKKGIKNNYLIRESADLHRSFSILTSTFERQHVKTKIREEDLIKMGKICTLHQKGKVLDCLDTDNNLLASVFLVHDSSTMYYLMGGYNTDLKNSGGMTYLLQQCIQEALKQKMIFNFCGSSRKSIAHYFEGFSAQKIDIAIWKKGLL